MTRITLFALALFAFASCEQAGSKSNGKSSNTPSSTTTEKKTQDEPKKENPDGLFAVITTTRGTITARLEMERAPLTVANFVALAEGTMPNKARALGVPYFDGLTFHRVVPNFVIQGGDPEGTGSGGPGYSFRDEFHPELIHNSGVLSMANSGPATNGSQFFITHKDTAWLNGKHTVFGKVTKGMDVVNAIRKGDTIKSIKVLDSTDALFAAQKANIDKWNVTLGPKK